MPDKRFLEEYPLYKKFEIKIPKIMNDIPNPSINFHCDVCDSSQTYVMGNDYYYATNVINTSTLKYSLRCRYICIGCQTDEREFLIKVSDKLDWIMKIGQFPPWDIKGDRRVEKMLGSHKSYLSQGLICESQGYGIGAFAYYRLITEEIIDALLRDVGDLIPENERGQFDEAFKKVSTTRQTSEKIALVKDLLPVSLQIDGMNPLGILHSSLSEGLHADSDEACLVHAETVREVLVYLASQIAEIKNSKSQFSAKMRKLLKDK